MLKSVFTWSGKRWKKVTYEELANELLTYKTMGFWDRLKFLLKVK